MITFFKSSTAIKKPSLFGILGSLLVAATYFAIILSNTSYAAPVIGFNAGRIIDDGVFTNQNSMSPSQIQTFLNSKVPTCDTAGTLTSEFGGGTRAQWGAAHGHPAPFTCLKDYTEGGRSAAQIIYDTAQQYQINPQVFIVLLQKEQGLVTDTWPLDTQYRTATGYGCPDTAPCDTQYFGLTNQLGWSGRMFRAILNNSPTWYTPYVLGNNVIQWNPSTSCGAGFVNIVNRSTQALYNYTPYQPNQAALNAGYGSGDSCSSYGNRNFYNYFTDWFGSTTLACGANEQLGATIVRLYNPKTYAHFYTSYNCEAAALSVLNGYQLEGDAFYQNSPSAIDAVVVHRLYNQVTGQHLWATTQEEINSATRYSGYTYEGPAFWAINPTTSGTMVVHRLYNPKTYKHLWVTTQAEINSATRYSGYTYEGPAFWVPGATKF